MEPSRKLEVTTPGDREIVMTRTFDAPREQVFDAFTKPELVRRWLLGPDGWSMPVCDSDLKAGGTLRYVWHNDTDGREFGISGTYRDIVRPELIVRTERFDGEPGEALVATAFVEHGNATSVTMTIRHESRESRDAAIESGMERGIAVSYDRLAKLLAGRA